MRIKANAVLYVILALSVTFILNRQVQYASETRELNPQVRLYTSEQSRKSVKLLHGDADPEIKINPVVKGLDDPNSLGRELEDLLGKENNEEQDGNDEPEEERRDLVVGVLTDPKSLKTIGMAAYTTWIRDLEAYATVYFVIGSCESDTKGFPGNVICLDTPDTYPPQRKVFLLWRYLHEHFNKDFSWFMKVDHDSYINVPLLLKLVGHLKDGSYRFRRSYIGLPATGRASERAKLGLNGKRYCSGLGYLINDLTLAAMGPHLDNCLNSVVSNHSDTEVGRCVNQHAGSQCQAVQDYPFKQVYYQQDGPYVYPMKLITGGQMKLLFPREPKATHFNAVLVHPLKHAEDFYRFHKQTMSRLRPVQPLISKQSAPLPYRLALQDLRTTCVNNPIRQIEKGKFMLRECESLTAEEPITLPERAMILTGDGGPVESYQETQYFRDSQSFLSESNIEVTKVVIPDWASAHQDTLGTNAKRSYLRVLHQIFRNATLTGARRLFILEDRVVFHCNFKHELLELLQGNRCSGHLFTDFQGGVLLLGADEASPAGLEKIESDRSQAFADNHHDVKAAMCYNTNNETRGSLGVIFHRSAFGEVLSWLTRADKTGLAVPFSDVYAHMAEKGFIVRAAFPNLILRDVPRKPEEDVPPEQIAARVRWREEKYCRGGSVHPV